MRQKNNNNEKICRNIEQVNLSKDNNSRNVFLQSLMEQLNKIRMLDLREKKLTNIVPLAEALQANTSIIALSLGKNTLDKESVKALSEMLNKNTTLETLSLSNNQLGDEKAVILIAALEKSSLKELSLAQNELTDSTGEALSVILQKNRSLKKINLRGNNLTDESGISIVNCLTITEELNLSLNQLTDKTGKACAAMLEKNDCLQKLYLSGNDLTEKTQDAFEKSLPHNISLCNVSLDRSVLETTLSPSPKYSSWRLRSRKKNFSEKKQGAIEPKKLIAYLERNIEIQSLQVKAQEQAKKKNYEQTVIIYGKAINLSQGEKGAWYLYNERGKIFQKQGQEAEAIDDYNQAIALSPEKMINGAMIYRMQKMERKKHTFTHRKKTHSQEHTPRKDKDDFVYANSLNNSQEEVSNQPYTSFPQQTSLQKSRSLHRSRKRGHRDHRNEHKRKHTSHQL